MNNSIKTVTMTPSSQKQGVVVSTDVLYLNDIPEAMEKMGWHVSAKMMRRWFSTKPAYVMTPEVRDANLIASDLLPSQFDDQIIKLDWALEYDGCLDAFEFLAQGGWITENGLSLLKRRLIAAGWTPGKEFRLGSTRMKAIELEDLCQVNRKGFGEAYDVINDMYGAIGTGTMKIAVVGKTKVSDLTGRDNFVIEKIGLYIRDTYDFTDDPKWKNHGLSEPLGVWSRNRCLTKEESAEFFLSRTRVTIPLAMNNLKFKGFVPVANKDFRRWQDAHNSGGDFIVYSDVKWIEPPVQEVELPR